MKRTRINTNKNAANHPIHALQQATSPVVSTSLPMFTIDVHGLIIKTNSCFTALLHYSDTALLHQPMTVLFDRQHSAPDELAATLRHSPYFLHRVQMYTATGQCCWFDVLCLPFTGTTTQSAHTVFICAEATQTIAREQQHSHLTLLAQSVHATGTGICIVQDTGDIAYHNAPFTHMLGLGSADMAGKPVLSCFARHPQTHAFLNAKNITSAQTHHLYLQHTDPHTHTTWLSVHLTPIMHVHNLCTHIVCQITDITSIKIQEMLQHQALHAMARDAASTEVMTLIDSQISLITPHVIPAIYQLDASNILHSLAGPDLPPRYREQVEAMLSRTPDEQPHSFMVSEHVPTSVLDNITGWQPHLQHMHAMGISACHIHPIYAKDYRVMGLLVFYDTTPSSSYTLPTQLIDILLPICALVLERDESRSKIAQLAYFDGLTGLANRSMINIQASQAIARATMMESTLAVLFIDLDRFKQVNDSLGHQAGDALLRTIAARLKSQARKSDIVGRLSGDEFVVILTQCIRDKIPEIVQRIQHALSQTCHINGIALTPSASIGVSIFPDNGNNIDTLLHRADMAMYLAKEKMRGSFGFFSEEMNTQAQERLAIESALREALEQKHFRLFYQPQIHLQEHHLYGVEALARWEHPEWGNVSPDRFIPILEECGLIGAFSQWVLEEACRQMADWKARQLPILRIAVNLSASNFHDMDLAGIIGNLLTQHQLSPEHITLEITETVLMDTNPDTTQNILDIHALGIRIAIDDFGTGYSSLSYLRNLPVSELKLDKAFVQEMEAEPTVYALTNAVIRIGESLSLTVIAEGVENQAQYDLLHKQRCDIAQGYYFSAALAADALEVWVNQYQAAPPHLSRTIPPPDF